MYVSTQLLRVHHEEWLRHAETRRLIKQSAAASSRSSRRGRRPGRSRGLLRGLGRRRPVSSA